ncbi:hypothetical protein NLJ89_g10517 [Agrocybe chaxingu]|uniref:F-box domain-containing protein n=1 Tax=Agrocybe chaxingu TaxID=84603 RepID=A0A9W8JQG6_9AGAR|nr:hypothetical protein NLJ89_g10517 [Agrocybe chaxingu]
MAMYTTQEELETLVNDYRRDLERTELLRRQSLTGTGRPSLIHRLPPEVLLEVFSILLDNHSRNMVFPSHVCRLWQSLITESSWLWTSIALSDYNEDGEIVPSYLNTIIQRANTPVLKVAGKAEWCSISYKSDEIEDFIPFFDGSFNVAHVRRLSLSSSRRGTGIFELDLLGGVVDMHPFKQLKSRTLDFPQEVRTNNFLVPWHQLTDLEITAYMDSLHARSVLRHCINLKNCQLCLATSEDIERIYHERVEQDQIRLPSLEQLQLTAIEVPSLVPGKLQCPILRNATFNYGDNDCDNESSKLFLFIRSCGTTLRKLRLPGLATDILNEIQGDLQALEELTISGPFGQPESLEYSIEEKSYSPGINAFFQCLRVIFGEPVSSAWTSKWGVIYAIQPAMRRVFRSFNGVRCVLARQEAFELVAESIHSAEGLFPGLRRLRNFGRYSSTNWRNFMDEFARLYDKVKKEDSVFVLDLCMTGVKREALVVLESLRNLKVLLQSPVDGKTISYAFNIERAII